MKSCFLAILMFTATPSLAADLDLSHAVFRALRADVADPQRRLRGRAQVDENPASPVPLSPTDGATGRSISLSLTCTSNGATLYTLDFGTANPPVDSTQDNASCDFAPGTLTYDTTYYWQITACNAHGCTAGDVWSFTTASAIDPAIISLSDLTFLGYKRFAHGIGSQNCWLLNATRNMAVKKVAGHVVFLMAQDQSPLQYAPCEYTDDAVYDADGMLISGVGYNTTLASSQAMTQGVNWGVNDDGSTYDWLHGKFGLYYDSPTTQTTDGSAYNIGYSATPTGILVTESAAYGTYRPWGATHVTLDDPNSGGNRVTTAVGPINFKVPIGNVPGASPSTILGLRAGAYFFPNADGDMCGGGSSGSYQQGPSPNGPMIFCSATWVSNSSPTTYSSTVDLDDEYLMSYSLASVMQSNFTLPGGQPNWAFRKPGYSYVTEGPGSQGAPLALDPLLNSGNGSWGESDAWFGAVWVETATKRGVINFFRMASNHLAGNTVACTNAHTAYCAGGSCRVDLFPPNGACVLHDCPWPVSVTGPVTTVYEPMFAIYDPNQLRDVRDGMVTDYAPEPDRIFPLDTWPGLPFKTDGVNAYQVGTGWFDPDSNIFYLIIVDGDVNVTQFGETRPVIAAWHIDQ